VVKVWVVKEEVAQLAHKAARFAEQVWVFQQVVQARLQELAPEWSLEQTMILERLLQKLAALAA